MAYSVFSLGGLAQVVRAGDSRRFGVDLKNDRDGIIAAASENALGGRIKLSEFHTTTLRGKPCVSYGEYERALVLRSVARHLRRRLRLRLPDRNQTVRGVITALLDSTPFSVIRCDIASFYETVPIAELRDRLLYDTASSTLVRAYFKDFFDSHCSGKTYGLPRGAGLSAILAELAIRPFDERVRSISGVYRYFRYADDIVALVSGPPAPVLEKMRGSLPAGMRLNRAKTYIKELTASTGDDAPDRPPQVIDYLGYRIAVDDVSGRSKSRRVDVSISDKKVSRLKSKVILAFREYKVSRDDGLLLRRINLLTSNYRVKRSGNATIKGSSHIKSGIYYNYALCGGYRVNGRMEVTRTPANLSQLHALDGMLRSLVRGRTSSFRNAIRLSMTNATRQRLLALSFASGFQNRMLYRVTPSDVSEIKRAWRNA